jgi:type I restriction enzyme, S subunit
VLLDRILAERRRRWEELELARMKSASKPHKNDEWKSKYKEPVVLDTSTLPQLPEGWCWAPLDALASVVGGVTKGQRRKPTDELRRVPYLRVANVQRGYLDLSVIKEIEATEDEIKELHLKSGDVLFNEGGDRDKLGRGWVWNGEIPECIHQNHVFRARMFTQDLLPRFLSWYGNSSAQLFFLQEGKQTTNLASLNSTNLKKLPVPLPPLAEQKRIAAEIELLLSVADATVNTTDAAIARCNRLRQSILKWAFEGKLVDQDPNNEPTSVLLERIRAERAAAAPSRKPKKTETPQTEAAK